MKTIKGILVHSLSRPFSKSIKTVLVKIWQHSCICTSLNGLQTGGLVLPNRIIVAPFLDRQIISVKFNCGLEVIGRIIAKHNELTLNEDLVYYKVEATPEVPQIRKAKVKTGNFMFYGLNGQVHVLERVDMQPHNITQYSTAFCGLPIFGRKGGLIGVAELKKGKRVYIEPVIPL